MLVFQQSIQGVLTLDACIFRLTVDAFRSKTDQLNGDNWMQSMKPYTLKKFQINGNKK